MAPLALRRRSSLGLRRRRTQPGLALLTVLLVGRHPYGVARRGRRQRRDRVGRRVGFGSTLHDELRALRMVRRAVHLERALGLSSRGRTYVAFAVRADSVDFLCLRAGRRGALAEYAVRAARGRAARLPLLCGRHLSVAPHGLVSEPLRAAARRAGTVFSTGARARHRGHFIARFRRAQALRCVGLHARGAALDRVA